MCAASSKRPLAKCSLLTKHKDIGGWPKILDEEPDRPHQIITEPTDETDTPHDINFELKGVYSNVRNIYPVLDTFLQFYDLGLYPPKWVLDHLASIFRKHMKDPDPGLLATQFGVTSRGSGTNNPFHEYRSHVDQFAMLTDMSILLRGFDVNMTEAAKAVKAKYKLKIGEKRITAIFRNSFGGRQLWRVGASGTVDDPFMFEPVTGPKEFLATFPRTVANRLIKKRMPPKT